VFVAQEHQPIANNPATSGILHSGLTSSVAERLGLQLAFELHMAVGAVGKQADSTAALMMSRRGTRERTKPGLEVTAGA
jgi:hypothetical protein